MVTRSPSCSTPAIPSIATMASLITCTSSSCKPPPSAHTTTSTSEAAMADNPWPGRPQIMSKTPSLAQIAANRRNAQESTGPRTPEGRAVSRMNAVKHGILSSHLLVCSPYLKESAREFATLRQRCWEDLSPHAPLEEMLVDQIVTAQWRLRRALKAESGEIALALDAVRPAIAEPNLRSKWLLWQASGDVTCAMRQSALGIFYLESYLKKLRALVEKEGELTEAAVQDLVESLGGQPTTLTEVLLGLRSRSLENPGGLEPDALRARHKDQVLAYIDRELGFLSSSERESISRESAQHDSRPAAATLPSLEVLDKILRYETKLERQMYRAMNQLERLQRLRQGEPVPPPLTVEVSERP